MTHRRSIHPVRPFILSLMLLLLVAAPACAGFRLMGSVGGQGYGYEDAEEQDHLWMIGSGSFSLIQTGGPWSVHYGSSFLKDNISGSDVTEDPEDLLLLRKAYLQYGRIGSPVQVKAGRFFLARGVALGVLDGMDVSYALNSRVRLSGFVGMAGAMSREYEFDGFDQAMSYGAEVKLVPSKCLLPAKGMLALSYVQTQRDKETIRNLFGVQTYHKFIDMPLTWMNNLQLRPTGNPFRKWISRLRYQTHSVNLMAELGVIGFDVANYSWFSDFEAPARARVRLVGDYYFVPGKWAAGAEIQTLLSGFRMGPVVTTPWGQAGYRLSSGDYGVTSGPWVNAHYAVSPCLELYAFAQMMSYEWDAFDIETQDLTSVLYGGRLTPKFMPSMTASLQVQVYTTPELSYDQRILGGLTWRFDTGRTGR